jgi:hypothetical protein
MALRIAAARVRKLAETRPKAIHAVLLRDGTARSQASFYTKRIYKFLVRFPPPLLDESGFFRRYLIE